MNLLGILAKHWTPGEVKTRLAAAIGADTSARLHHAFLATLLARFRNVGDARVVCFTPIERRPDFEHLAAGAWQLVPQAAGDLGSRMRAFFDWAFDTGASRVVLLGADSPTLPVSMVTAAFAALETSSVVLGPADDGGYYLLGAAQRPPPVFEGISWGTPAVLEQTRARLEAGGVRHSLLPTWYDVDELPDLERLADELATVCDDPALLALRKVVEELSGHA